MRNRGAVPLAPVLLGALFLLSFVGGAAMALDGGGEPAPEGHPRLETIGEAQLLLDGDTAQGRPYRLIERRTSEGRCLQLQLGAPGESETETCGYRGLPVLAVEDVQRGEQLVFGLGTERTHVAEVSSAGRTTRRQAVRAQEGQARAFVVPLPGPASRREVMLVERGNDETVQRSHRFTFRGPQAHRFSSAAERDAEFDFHTRY